MAAATPASRSERYAIHSVLGRGGMGVVYAATDRVRGVEVALKRLSLPENTNDKLRERGLVAFEREYYSLSELEHPHIIAVYDYGCDQHGPYYTMELLAGENLRARSPLPFREASKLVRDIASALALLHSRSLVHRDVSLLNIHCTPAGDAKLIDFGAMMPNGVARLVIGTPPFVPPECLQQESLDGRADLYALGGCLYFALTGEYAYPARTFDELRGMFQLPVRAPSELVPDVPAALDELVLSLLSLDASARPRTAADVYERLTAIADLPRTEAFGSARAYLTKPSLVGRADSTAILHARARRAVAGHGGATLIQGERGIGRSRLLDVAALEAKLSGMSVARADAARGRFRAFGAAALLIDALAPEHPRLQQAADASGLGAWLQSDAPAGLTPERRANVLRELDRALIETCEERACALIVDDVHALDEPSVALLAGLAARAHDHALAIVCTADAAFRPAAGSAHALLAEYAQPLALAPLDAVASRQLLAAILGEVPNVDMLAAISYRRCQGNPQALMELLRALIELDLLQYVGGSWVIHSSPDAIARASEERGLAQRLAGLSADALELLQWIAIDEFELLTLARHAALSSHADPARIYRALSELVNARWISLQDERARIPREDLRRAVREGLSEARSRELHARMAEQCVALGLAANFEAHYRFGAQQPLAACVALDEFEDFAMANPDTEVLRHEVTLTGLDAGSRLSGLSGICPSAGAKYLAGVMLNATYRGLSEFAAERLPQALEAIAPFSGVADYRELAALPEQQRLSDALARAAERCAPTGPGALSIFAAIRRNSQLSVATAVTANFMQDVRLTRAIPDLTPFRALSPALALSIRVVEALVHFVHGRTWAAWDALELAHTELDSPECASIDGFTRMQLSRTILAYLCGMQADLGCADMLQLIDGYAVHMPDLAESHRSRFYLARGDVAAATAARRRFEELSMLRGSLADARILELPAHLALYGACGDSVGLRRTLLALEEVAKTRPGWRARVQLTRALLQRSQGQIGAGLETIEALLAELAPPHIAWHEASAAHVSLLMAAGRANDAAERGRAYVLEAERTRLPEFRVELALAPALAALECHDEAEHHYAQALACLQERRASGVIMATLYEVGARIALARDDTSSFSTRAAACAAQVELGKHAALIARYNALLRDARRRAAGVPLRAARPGDDRLHSLQELSRVTLDDASFQRALLDFLLEASDAKGGVIYRREPGGLQRTAASGEIAGREGLDEFALPYFDAASDAATQFMTRAEEEPEREGIQICLLQHGAARALAGVAVLEVRHAGITQHVDLDELGAMLAARGRVG